MYIPFKLTITFVQETDVDTDNEEIRQRDEAIAKAESDAAQLQRELRETEQSELTDTGRSFSSMRIFIPKDLYNNCFYNVTNRRRYFMLTII